MVSQAPRLWRQLLQQLEAAAASNAQNELDPELFDAILQLDPELLDAIFATASAYRDSAALLFMSDAALPVAVVGPAGHLDVKAWKCGTTCWQ